MRIHTGSQRTEPTWIRYTIIFLAKPVSGGSLEADVLLTEDFFTSGNIIKDEPVLIGSQRVGVVHALGRPKGTVHVMLDKAEYLPEKSAA